MFRPCIRRSLTLSFLLLEIIRRLYIVFFYERPSPSGFPDHPLSPVGLVSVSVSSAKWGCIAHHHYHHTNTHSHALYFSRTFLHIFTGLNNHSSTATNFYHV